MSGTDPYEPLSRRQTYVKKDFIKYFIKASDCITTDQLSKKTGKPIRALWRPPRDWVKQQGQQQYCDERGSFSKFFGAKITLKNKLNTDLRFKATVPVGKISDPTQIYARPVIVEGCVKPSGVKKDMSRSKGKGKRRREKSYSKAQDQVTIDISERSLFRGDANLYSMYEEKIPGDDTLTPNYHVFGFGVGDVAIILPNSNQFTGSGFSEDLVVCEMLITVRYVVSQPGYGLEGAQVEKVSSFYLAELATPDALYHRDVDPVMSGMSSGTMIAGAPLVTILPLEKNHLLGVKKMGDAIVLHTMEGKREGLFRWDVYQNANMRIAPIGSEFALLTSDKYARGEFRFDEKIGWKLVNELGATLKAASNIGDGFKIIANHRVPVCIYSSEAARFSKNGLIADYGSKNARAISFKAIVAALTVTIKVLEYAMKVASIFV